MGSVQHDCQRVWNHHGDLAIAYNYRTSGERRENLERAIEHYELALQVAPIDHSVLGQSVVGDESSPRG